MGRPRKQLATIASLAPSVVIEHDVPLPTRGNRNVNGGPMLPYGDMKIGDSIFLPGLGIKAASGNSYHWGKKLKMKLSTRVVDGGVRIWRIK